MKLELDKRIDSLSDILNFSDVENARKFIEQKGYFTNNLYCFINIRSCKYGTLINVFNDSVSYNTFCRKEDGAYYEFFIPESRLKSKEQENEDLKKQVEDLKEKIKFWENRYKALEDQYLSVKQFFLEDR